MVIVPAAHVALTPEGKPLAPETPSLLMPVAPVVVWVTPAGNAVLIHTGVLTPALTVLLGLTVIVPVALTVPQPPVNAML